MSEMTVTSSANMLMSATDIQESSIMKLINSGAQVANNSDGSGSQLRTDAMNERGVGQRINTIA